MNTQRCAHLRTTGTGMTRMLARIPLSLREGLAEASARLAIPQQVILRSALAAWLQANAPEPEPVEPVEPVRKGRRRKGGAQ
jgi:hypothetical protein